MRLGESLEDYLETLLLLEASGHIRCVDVARLMNVSKPSVNKAMNVLKEKGLVTQQVYGEIHLTEEGRQVAKEIYNRHQIVKGFLVHVLGVSEANAEEDACHIEHVISKETFDLMTKYYKERTNQN